MLISDNLKRKRIGEKMDEKALKLFITEIARNIKTGADLAEFSKIL